MIQSSMHKSCNALEQMPANKEQWQSWPPLRANGILHVALGAAARHGSPTEKRRKGWNLPKRAPLLRDAVLIGLMRWVLRSRPKEKHPDVSMAFGCTTKSRHIRLGLEKPHVRAACRIEGTFDVKTVDTVAMRKKVRRKNRRLFKANTPRGGKRRKNQAPYTARALRLFDRVRMGAASASSPGAGGVGASLGRLTGHASTEVSGVDLTLVEERKGYLTGRRERQFLSRS